MTCASRSAPGAGAVTNKGPSRMGSHASRARMTGGQSGLTTWRGSAESPCLSIGAVRQPSGVPPFRAVPVEIVEVVFFQ